MPTIKPLLKLTKAQWKELLKRLMEKQGKLTTKQAETVVERLAPMAEVEYGTLWKPMPGAPETLTPIRLPIEQARALYQAAPEQYTLRPPGPPARELAALPPPAEPLGPEELAKRVAYERVREVPVVPPRTRAERVVRQELTRQSREAQLRRVGLRLEDIRPEVKIETVLEEVKGYVPPPELPPVADMAAIAAKADALWKFAKGSLVHQMFDQYRQASAWAKSSPHIKNARDYFISCYTRYQQDPAKFTRAWPREAKMIRWVEQQYDEAAKGLPGVE